MPMELKLLTNKIRSMELKKVPASTTTSITRVKPKEPGMDSPSLDGLKISQVQKKEILNSGVTQVSSRVTIACKSKVNINLISPPDLTLSLKVHPAWTVALQT